MYHPEQVVDRYPAPRSICNSTADDTKTSTDYRFFSWNRSSKQIIIVFRGTVNTKDLLVDSNFAQHTPPVVKEITDRKAKLHKGFSGKFV
jgi:hypothetical protein